MPRPTKDNIRKPLLQQRSQLTKQQQQEKSQLIIEAVKQSNAFLQAKNIAVYHAVRGEADPATLVSPYDSEETDKQFYLPVISSNENKGLVFAPINKETNYKNNKFSIPEPIVNTTELIDAQSLDLVIMPLLGFDEEGNRLGMGGGYYDRCFAFKQSDIQKPLLLGFAYEFQKVSLLDAEPWDIGLDMVVTEQRSTYFNQ